MNRRSFFGSILAFGVAPAIVRVDSLMRPVARDALVVGLRVRTTSRSLRASDGSEFPTSLSSRPFCFVANSASSIASPFTLH